ncbi:glyoxalase [Mycolicibacterium sp. 624]|uniref:glyoxalase n=1 Tax=Mycolicibacterium sp. 624 TaxID=3156314 RepID=UPI00339A4053
MTETTIPMLPCVTVDDTVEFYEALGFDVTRRQHRPYLYMAFLLGGVELNFKDAAPRVNPSEELTGGCLVMVDAVEGYHRDFTSGLRRRYGRVPTQGLPRLTRLRPGQTRFCLYDPSGNCVVFIERDEPAIEYGGARSMSGLAKALDNVRILRDYKNDDALAAQALDVALRRHGDGASRLDLARAIANRVELAIALGDSDGADARRDDLVTMALDAGERAEIDDDLRAIDEIARWLSN